MDEFHYHFINMKLASQITFLAVASTLDTAAAVKSAYNGNFALCPVNAVAIKACYGGSNNVFHYENDVEGTPTEDGTYGYCDEGEVGATYTTQIQCQCFDTPCDAATVRTVNDTDITWKIGYQGQMAECPADKPGLVAMCTSHHDKYCQVPNGAGANFQTVIGCAAVPDVTPLLEDDGTLELSMIVPIADGLLLACPNTLIQFVSGVCTERDGDHRCAGIDGYFICGKRV